MPSSHPSSSAAALEVRLQNLVAVYVVTGLLFMLLPGTFLGVWNLLSISGQRSLNAFSQAWLQAHGHAQIFGWIGTFIIGIGYYSLSKMARLPPFAVSRGWTTWFLWICGVTLRWIANVKEWNWRLLLPVSAALQLGAFLIFLATVSRHRPRPALNAPVDSSRPRMEPWIRLVSASIVGLLLVLLLNQAETLYLAVQGSHPEIPHWLDQRYLILATWGFPVLAVWGFNARWLPVFLGLRSPSGSGLTLALITCGSGVGLALLGQLQAATVVLVIAAVVAVFALRVFERTRKPPKTLGVHFTFPLFVRGAYIWLLISAALGVLAAEADAQGGIWGASRHALTVGFLATMVFAIGQRVLPAFCGMRLLYSTRLMFASLVLLNAGCFLRVVSEVPAYEGYLQAAWRVLPASAVMELTAVTLFALNLGITLILPPTRSAVSERSS
jgi:uncharacterized protein involved in response to NO